jgi:hypothetical protein
MTVSLMAFFMMAAASVLFLSALVVGEEMIRIPVLRQTGDSSLGPRSVNWMGGLALLAAVLICLA